MNVIETSVLDQPGLEPYKTLRRPVDHHREGIFVAEGEKVVRRLLESRLNVLSLLLTPEWLEQLRPILTESNAEVFVTPKKTVEQIVGFPLHQGIMAVGRIPPEPSLEQLLTSLSVPPVLAAVDGLTNAENLGVLVRNCTALGVQGLFVGETSSSPWLRRAVRNSMGAVFTLPILHSPRLTETLRDLKDRGLSVLAADPKAETHLGQWTGNPHNTGVCVVFGSEGEGISAPVLEACDERLAVPMRSGVDSLNVASASAVFLYELTRRMKP